ncbi:hypothetical protein IM40_09675 (plasmid) [Candidatus Paracaedimonas acanthamoebae]|nr:hypothetical protein IM40_09675 [Candidatus Paracaedimonas acanthamoebae]
MAPQNNNSIFLPWEDSHPLIIIQGIKFTSRELDIIACLMCGRATKTIASFLSIAPKTIETHIRNILLKVGGSTRENIIDFIERAGKGSLLRKHYQFLLLQAGFKKSLKEISALMRQEPPISCVVYDAEGNKVIDHLIKDLQLLSIESTIMTQEKEVERLIAQTKQANLIKPLLYVVSHIHAEKLQESQNQENLKLEELIPKAFEDSTSIIFLFLHKNELNIGLKNKKLSYVSLSEQGNYYFFLMELLRELLPDIKLDKIIADFRDYYTLINQAATKKFAHLDPEANIPSKRNSSNAFMKRFLMSKKHKAISFLIISIGALIFFKLKEDKGKKPVESLLHHKAPCIRSDLVTPTETTLLNRPALIAEIDYKLKGQSGIQILALIGMGGAGKTTLARQYAKIQHASVVWEINAETKASLINSFENFAYVLSQTEEERKLLKDLRDITNPQEREDKILLFIKDHLRYQPNWFLIYDNVEKFTDIQKYFPQDFDAWGKGKIIVTTRDSTLQNNSYINKILYISDLSSQEKLTLFMKIMGYSECHQFTLAQRQQAEKFLTHIPPFPLDVSIAAYYLKVTNVSYEDYLKHLKAYSKEFINIQENILKEASAYAKTRYGIVILSLQNLTRLHKEFKELLLFISLINSYYIPRDLLNGYKNNAIVDTFIYNLKKYSLITNELSLQTGPVFSIHKSTQATTLSYLISGLSLDKENVLFSSIATTLRNYMVHVIEKEDFARMNLLVGHGEAFLNHANLFNESVIGSIKGKLGRIYSYLGYYKEAKQLLKESLISLKKDKNYLENAQALGYLGLVYRSLGNYQKTQDLFEQSFNIYKRYLPGDLLGTAEALANLGIIYRDLGKYEKAKEMLESSLALYHKRRSSGKLLGMAWALAHLGITYRDLGNYEKAKEVLEECLAVYKKEFPHNQVRTSWVLVHLGNIYKSLGNQEKAKEILEQNLKIYKELYGNVHIRTAWVLTILGQAYQSLGQYEKSENSFKEALNIYENNYSKDHVKVAFSLRSLGHLYLLQDNLKSAEDFLKRSSKILQKENRPDAYIALELLADLFLKKASEAKDKGETQHSKYFKDQAIDCLAQALKAVRDHFPAGSPHIARIQAKHEHARDNI